MSRWQKVAGGKDMLQVDWGKDAIEWKELAHMTGKEGTGREPPKAGILIGKATCQLRFRATA